MNRFRRSLTSVAALATTSALAVALTAPPAGAGTDDLAGLWLLNEGSGQVANDLSFSGNRGQLGSTSGVDAQRPGVDLPAPAAPPQARRTALLRLAERPDARRPVARARRGHRPGARAQHRCRARSAT